VIQRHAAEVARVEARADMLRDIDHPSDLT
jgi:hypothetical protein